MKLYYIYCMSLENPKYCHENIPVSLKHNPREGRQPPQYLLNMCFDSFFFFLNMCFILDSLSSRSFATCCGINVVFGLPIWGR